MSATGDTQSIRTHISSFSYLASIFYVVLPKGCIGIRKMTKVGPFVIRNIAEQPCHKIDYYEVGIYDANDALPILV